CFVFFGWCCFVCCFWCVLWVVLWCGVGWVWCWFVVVVGFCVVGVVVVVVGVVLVGVVVFDLGFLGGGVGLGV
ncbi:hypothetical protein, partial [Klebsiella pneumoniae]|uniref:hypothetical protein n=1 Tax=Klebsiella pneumoniae TaxID=573 RepID=UPI001C530466